MFFRTLKERLFELRYVFGLATTVLIAPTLSVWIFGNSVADPVKLGTMMYLIIVVVPMFRKIIDRLIEDTRKYGRVTDRRISFFELAAEVAFRCLTFIIVLNVSQCFNGGQTSNFGSLMAVLIATGAFNTSPIWSRLRVTPPFTRLFPSHP